jgi:hypothetical protein
LYEAHINIINKEPLQRFVQGCGVSVYEAMSYGTPPFPENTTGKITVNPYFRRGTTGPICITVHPRIRSGFTPHVIYRI